MTIGDWYTQGCPMVWSILEEKASLAQSMKVYTNDAQWSDDFHRIPLDLSAPKGAPDGIHMVYYQSGLNSGVDGNDPWTGEKTG